MPRPRSFGPIVSGAVMLAALGATAQAQTAPITDCDIYAAPHPPNERVPGILFVKRLSHIKRDYERKTQINPARAIPACLEAIAKHPDTPRFYYYLALSYDAAHDRDTAMKYARRAAEKKYVEAEVFLAHKSNLKSDTDQPLYWYQRAASNGSLHAQSWLGSEYLKGGYGLTRDKKRGLELIRRAAEGGYAGAQYDLGKAYEEGDGITKDLNRAAEWYKKAADQGDLLAARVLAQLMMKVDRIDDEVTRLLNYWTFGHEQGDIQHKGFWTKSGTEGCVYSRYREGEGIVKTIDLSAFDPKYTNIMAQKGMFGIQYYVLHGSDVILHTPEMSYVASARLEREWNTLLSKHCHARHTR